MAFDRYGMMQRVVRDVSRRDLPVELFGRRLSRPIVLGAIGMLELARKDGDLPPPGRRQRSGCCLSHQAKFCDRWRRSRPPAATVRADSNSTGRHAMNSPKASSAARRRPATRRSWRAEPATIKTCSGRSSNGNSSTRIFNSSEHSLRQACRLQRECTTMVDIRTGHDVDRFHPRLTPVNAAGASPRSHQRPAPRRPARGGVRDARLAIDEVGAGRRAVRTCSSMPAASLAESRRSAISASSSMWPVPPEGTPCC